MLRVVALCGALLLPCMPKRMPSLPQKYRKCMPNARVYAKLYAKMCEDRRKDTLILGRGGGPEMRGENRVFSGNRKVREVTVAGRVVDRWGEEANDR